LFRFKRAIRVAVNKAGCSFAPHTEAIMSKLDFVAIERRARLMHDEEVRRLFALAAHGIAAAVRAVADAPRVSRPTTPRHAA
jgi:hypothetical protein